MIPRDLIILFFVLLLVSSCQNGDKDDDNMPAIIPLEVPSKKGGEPNLFISASGSAFLSWVEYENDSLDVLKVSRLENDTWRNPAVVSEGTDWFVNWADFPSLVTDNGNDSIMAAHWLQKSAGGTYDYDVRISQSKDGGTSWSPSFIPHSDGIPAEHGFVTMLPLPDEQVFLTWLDGRNTKSEINPSSNIDDHGHGGAMTLRSAVFDKNGNLSQEHEMDSKICDCCQTDAALTDKGLIVAYRNRSESEIRDISIVRFVDGKWTEPRPAYNDNWHIPGCPVNGPAISADNNHVVLAWYSEADNQPVVKVAFSNDSGSNFLPPFRIDEGNPLGRVDVVMIADTSAYVSWMENKESYASIKAAFVQSSGKISNSIEIGRTNNSRVSGFPVMKKIGDKLLFTWTEKDSVSLVKSVYLKL